jgi:hypothetical protein
MGEDSGEVLQCQAVLADVDDMVHPLGLLAADAVTQADQQAVRPPGQLLVVSRVMRIAPR